MKSIQEMTNFELAAFIQDHLKSKGIDVILSGGACVSFYSSNKYVSMDLDLINVYLTKKRDISDAMREIGFIEEGRHFKNPDTDFFIEFPSGPLSVGEEPVKNISEFKLTTGILKLLSPTDSVKDRLAAYYHWNDLQCLEQAALIAENHRIDIDEIRRWSKKENKLRDFNSIKDRLFNQKSQG